PGWLMYLTCAMELVLSAVVFSGRWTTLVSLIQIGLILGFTTILAIHDPWLLAHPFGVLSKNLPLLLLIFLLWKVPHSGWSPSSLWLLRIAAALPWFTEGLFPKILFPQEMEIAIVAGSGLSPIAPENFLQFIGAMQVGSAILALTLKSSALRIVLLLQALGLVLFPILVGYQIPNMWFHPFGPFFKNLPVFIATVEVWKRCK
ncbi:MAG: hypothetical protein KDD43_05155, partial [Bdellovibrionales bacterium]|nr:hypothetical protein [Bdellovibrionales bacterium]